MDNKISIIVPFYNSSATIEKCIKSIINQTHKNFEAIFVNDGGVDESCEIVKKYMENDNRIKLINNNHGGVSSARNAGLRAATGEYIEFLDSDDYLEPNIMKRLLETSINHNADIVVCDYTHPTFKNYFADSIIDASNLNGLKQYYQTTFAVVVPWNKLYKKEVIKEFFDEEISFCEDELFGLANMFNAKKIVGIKDVLYHYYTAPDSNSAITTIGTQDKFWLSKDTYWYKRARLLEKSKKILAKNIGDTNGIDDFAYVRIFDFMIWELMIYKQFGASNEGLAYNVNQIFDEKEFIDCLKTKEKQGLSFVRGNKDLVRKYVDKCVDAIKEGEKNPNLKVFNICVMLFVKMFTIRNKFALNSHDLLAQSCIKLIENDGLEAQYVNSLQFN